MTGSKQGGPGAQLGKLRIHRGRAERSAHAADRSREFAGCEGRALELADQTPAMRPGGAGAAVSARNEARQGRCRQQRLACPAKEKPTGERTVAECLSRMFPRTSLTPGFRIGTQRKDFVCANMARVRSPRSGTSGNSGTQRCFPAEFAQTAFSREGATAFVEEIESRAPI